MSDIKKDQIGQWLKKLERESWQLELLVSAFTIFLLIQAIDSFSGFYEDLPFAYNLDGNILSFIYLFLGLLGMSIKALSIFLIVHLMLRGFWIGTIGLRSVQSEINFKSLNYNEFFSKRLKKRIISLDEMVIKLDEMCSVIFSFSFLIISVLIAFGLYFLLLGGVSVGLSFLESLTDGWLNKIFTNLTIVAVLVILLTGIIYMIDYFSLGFFKKYKTLGKIYYPIYRFYGFVTVSIISRSIYYYLISKFSKKRIRLVYLIFGGLVFFTSITEYDQFQYFSNVEDEMVLRVNYYDDLRPADTNIVRVSIPNNVVGGSFLRLFIRYDPRDNELIRNQCPDFEPLKSEGLNLTLQMKMGEKGLLIGKQNFEGEDARKLLECHSSIYRVSVNDSLYTGNQFFYFTHPDKRQKGLVTMLSTKGFKQGQNILQIKKRGLDDDGKEVLRKYAYVPFWLE
ncbi:MAG: hypothetical protein JXQ96_16720 [Cyclobacteriaceae bacterium]